MQTKNFKQAPSFPAKPEIVFKAWLDSQQHGDMINATAEIDPNIGGKFNVWDGYAIGETLEIDRDKLRIVQSWRDDTSDWPANYYSKITLEFVPDRANPNSTRLRFWHSGVPSEHVEDIAQGWKDYYWTPMQQYFTKI